MAVVIEGRSPAALQAASPRELIEAARSQGVVMVDLKFVDVPGQWQHFHVPIDQLTEQAFVEGFGFDGSSIRGFQAINESDMLLVPDLATAFIDPFYSHRTLSLVCEVRDPETGRPYERDPRYIARKAEAYLRATGIADVSYWGPEAEFFILDSARFHQDQHSGYYFVDSDEGFWNSGRDHTPNAGHRPRYKEGYFPVPPVDSVSDVRADIALTLQSLGVPVETHHHEVATAGQAEVDLRYASLTAMGDRVMMLKYVAKNVARRHGKTVTFMPKPLFGDNGSGMHTHQSLWKDGRNLFYDKDGYAGLSETARYYIGGLLAHGRALAALCSPTTNSYKRLVPGFEAPVNLVYSKRNRSAAVRIPMYSQAPAARRIEYRPPDPSANPYLAFAAMLLAGLDGIENRIDPGDPVDRDLYSLTPAELLSIRSLPGSLEEALEALQDDYHFLLKGGVFTKDFIDLWIAYKRQREALAVSTRPHPWEFVLYFD
ncbi:MAG: type I glutamate--ammonia ligase, partial [Firmicutes bacterium]|nr:type I glutamate--ammonia ligase [Bacillota bacterium]